MPFEEYSVRVMDHFLNPRNTGEVSEPTHRSQVTNPVCGDMMKLTVRVVDGRILEAKAKTFGCAAAIACSSVLTEMLIGRTVEDARKTTDLEIVESLGGLPEHKLKCSLVAQEAVRHAFG